MICPQCGNQIADGSQACPNCGVQFITPGAPTTENASAAPPPPPGYAQTAQQPIAADTPEQQIQATPIPAGTDAAPHPVASAAPAPEPETQQMFAVAPASQPNTTQQMPEPAPMPRPDAAQSMPAPTGQPAAPAQAAFDPPIAYAGPGQAGAFAPQPAPGAIADQAPKKNRKPLFIGLAAALVVILGVGIFAGVSAYQESQRSEAYAQAIDMMNNGDFEGAYAAFSDLGDYQDSQTNAFYCSQGMDYVKAQELLDSGDYEGALAGFTALGDYQDAATKADYCSAQNLLGSKDYEGALAAFTALGNFYDSSDMAAQCAGWISFKEAVALTDQGKYDEAAAKTADFSNVSAVTSDPAYSEWQKRNSYGIADKSFAAGHFYTAYNQFTALSGYQDADARAQACIQPTPGNVEFYHDPGFISSSTDLVFEAGAATLPNYIKVYSGETLVSSLFVNPGGSTTIQIPAGDYILKSGEGELWFGEAEMFGIDGYYGVMLFDGGNESVHLDDNKIYTVTLYMEGEGNVGNRSVGPEGF